MGQLRRFRSTPVDLCSSRLGRRTREELRMHRMLSQASTFCKFATLPLTKASYMARNSQYGRPLTKGMSEKRGKKLGVLTQAINHQWHLEQQLWCQENRSTLLLESFLTGFRAWQRNSKVSVPRGQKAKASKVGAGAREVSPMEGLISEFSYYHYIFFSEWVNEK